MPSVRTVLSTALACLAGLLPAVAGSTAPAQAAARSASTGGCVYAAHRGYQAHAPENSMKAFKAAVYRKADYLEMDVQVTSDGRFVLMHDQTVDRTTDGRGRIESMTYRQVAGLRMGDGQAVPTLASVLAMARPSTSGVLLELKWIPQSRFAALKRLIDAFGTSRVVVNGFSPWVVSRFHAQFPDVRTALDVGRPIPVDKAAAYGGVMPDVRTVSAAWLDDLRAAGVPVYLWTVDSPTLWQRYRGKVALVLTNRAADYDRWRRVAC